MAQARREGKLCRQEHPFASAAETLSPSSDAATQARSIEGTPSLQSSCRPLGPYPAITFSQIRLQSCQTDCKWRVCRQPPRATSSLQLVDPTFVRQIAGTLRVRHTNRRQHKLYALTSRFARKSCNKTLQMFSLRRDRRLESPKGLYYFHDDQKSKMLCHRIVGHRFERTAAPLRICTNQASRSASRVASVSSGDGASGILQGKGSCVFSFRAFGS
mgnify:CR=1 FL=1